MLRVIDGDTVDVQFDDGTTERIRLIGLNTPETVDPRRPVQCYGREASAKAHELLDGQAVTIELDPSQGERDRFGRLLAYLWLPDGRNTAEVLIGEGYGFEYTFRLPYGYQDQFRAAETYARENQLGLWAPDACAEPTPVPEEGEPAAVPAQAPVANCHPSYPDVCVPPPPPDLDCGDIPYRNFRVVGLDPHRFDADGDGIGCESRRR